uniref:Uncharacterized protein n=1 Tax=Anguilla anguilla TaxID=7936 RepID=A0A0E9QCU0_ANGAN
MVVNCNTTMITFSCYVSCYWRLFFQYFVSFYPIPSSPTYACSLQLFFS